MPITIIEEDGTGKADANSYISEADAAAYFDTTLYPGGWTAATDEQKKAALITATQTIDAEMVWRGSQNTEEQALAWPRTRAEHDGFAFTVFWPSDEIPRPLKAATCEMAKLLLASDRSAPSETDGIKSLGLGQGAVEIEFDVAASKPKTITDAVAAILAPLGRRKAGSTVKLSRA